MASRGQGAGERLRGVVRREPARSPALLPLVRSTPSSVRKRPPAVSSAAHRRWTPHTRGPATPRRPHDGSRSLGADTDACRLKGGCAGLPLGRAAGRGPGLGGDLRGEREPPGHRRAAPGPGRDTDPSVRPARDESIRRAAGSYAAPPAANESSRRRRRAEGRSVRDRHHRRPGVDQRRSAYRGRGVRR